MGIGETTSLIAPAVKQHEIVQHIYDFCNNTRGDHLTIQDILDLPLGVPVRLFCLDRNMEDFCKESAVPQRPSKFFANCYMVDFTREEGIRGTWCFTFDPTHTDRREFDVDLLTPTGMMWYPLNHGRVPHHSEDDGTHMGIHAGKPWTGLDSTTRIGWRGPMLLAAKLDDYPSVVYTDY